MQTTQEAAFNATAGRIFPQEEGAADALLAEARARLDAKAAAAAAAAKQQRRRELKVRSIRLRSAMPPLSAALWPASGF